MANDIEFRKIVADLINEIDLSCHAFDVCMRDYWHKESEASTDTKYIMLLNGWASPFIACNGLLRIIETDEKLLAKICKSEKITMREIGFASKAKEMQRKMMSVQCDAV